ncbi:MAG TPA: hypothetical protein EYP62_06715 [Kiritimatiellae bacterium]|nr:hypothetical protein [Kiritimatiellia bacterium]
MKGIALGRMLLIAFLLPGCSPPDRQEKGKAIRDAVDTVIIQRPKFETGVRASRKIRRLSAEHRKDLEEAMGD